LADEVSETNNTVETNSSETMISINVTPDRGEARCVMA
jgi:hypothetical protein